MQKCCFSGVVKPQEEEFGMLVEQAEGGKYFPNYRCPI